MNNVAIIRNTPPHNYKYSIYKINEIGQFYGGLTGKSKEDFSFGNEKFITYMNIYQNTIAKKEGLCVVNISDSESQNSVKQNDILFTQSSETPEEVGLASLWGYHEKVYLNSFSFGFRLTKQCVNPVYLVYLLRSPKYRKQISKLAQGISRYNLSSKRLGNIILNIPNYESQELISSFFKRMDEKISLAERKITTLEKLKSGLMQKIFSRELRFKKEDGSEFPDWKTKRLSTLFHFIRNGYVGTIAPFYTSKENGVRYLQGTNIHDGKITDDVEFYVTKEFNLAHSKNILKEDDILVVQSGHVGDCVVVGRYAGSNCHALIILSNSGFCNSKYICYYLKSFEAKKRLSLIEKGNTVKHILATDVAKFEVEVPDIKEQDKIVNFLTAIDQRLLLANAEIISLNKQKQSLMQNMFV